MENKLFMITDNLLTLSGKQVFSYSAFVSWVESLVAEVKTSGEKQSEARINFTRLNLARMKRIDKTTHLHPDLVDVLQNLESRQKWYVITEAWCGDSAQVLPVIAKMAAAAQGKITLQIILRDENPAWMQRYHTNGSRSIPKLIIFDEAGKEIFTWGPRPLQAQRLMMDWKENPEGRSWDDFEKELHIWYARDKAASVQMEFFHLMRLYGLGIHCVAISA